MKTIDLPLNQLRGAPWNPNVLDPHREQKLRASLGKYGLVQVLVVRPVENGYEVISGNHRLRALKDAGVTTVPCVVVDLDDAHARLLSQALNRVHGEDDLGLRAEVVREILEQLPQEEVLSTLPESAESLHALCSLGQEDMARYLENWQRAQAARLKHLQVQLTSAQLEVVEEALGRLLPKARAVQGDSPNTRGTALYLMARWYLETTREGA